MITIFASDIHGSGERCEQLVKRFEEEGAERLVLCGDILYHGPRNGLPNFYDPQQVIKLLNAMKDKIFCVQGNCDAEIDAMVLEFPILPGYAVISEPNRDIIVTHGHIFNEANLPPMKAGDLLVHGHTHIKDLRRMANGAYILNPGSTTVPKDGDFGSYAVYDGDKITIKKLDGTPISELVL